MKANLVCINSMAYCERDNSVLLTRVHKVVPGYFSISGMTFSVALLHPIAKLHGQVSWQLGLEAASHGSSGRGGTYLNTDIHSHLWKNKLVLVSLVCIFFPLQRCSLFLKYIFSDNLIILNLCQA